MKAATKTEMVYARVDKKTKKDAETLFSELGLNISTAIGMFIKQALIVGGLPFEAKIKRPITLEDLSKKEFETELQKGINSINSNNHITLDEFKSNSNKRIKQWESM